jgi:hypothetical protein
MFKTKKMKAKEVIQFPEFYFESNLYFGKVKSKEDLKAVFDAYKGHLTRDEILDVSKNIGSDDTSEFGMRIEHIGNINLRKFLSNHKIRFRR